MRYAVISDVHSNFEALSAVLQEAETLGFERLICLGDFVGYNADPSACLALLMNEADYSVIGNHDAAALDISVADYFNRVAREAAVWTSNQLSRTERDFLARLPFTLNPEPDVLLVHSAPSNPEMWSYILSTAEAYFEFESLKERICLFGHSHIQMAFVRSRDGTVRSVIDDRITFRDDERYLINPGSVGQPRDGDSRSAFGILDTDAGFFEFHRVPYDIQSAQDKIHRAGLPPALATRLARGT